MLPSYLLLLQFFFRTSSSVLAYSLSWATSKMTAKRRISPSTGYIIQAFLPSHDWVKVCWFCNKVNLVVHKILCVWVNFVCYFSFICITQKLPNYERLSTRKGPNRIIILIYRNIKKIVLQESTWILLMICNTFSASFHSILSSFL